MSTKKESNLSHGIGVGTKSFKMKTKKAPRSSPKLDPPTMICEYAEFWKTCFAMMGAIPFSRYR